MFDSLQCAVWLAVIATQADSVLDKVRAPPLVTPCMSCECSQGSQTPSLSNRVSLRKVVAGLGMGGTIAKALLRSRNRRLYLRLRSGISSVLAITTCWWASSRQVAPAPRPGSAAYKQPWYFLLRSMPLSLSNTAGSTCCCALAKQLACPHIHPSGLMPGPLSAAYAA